MFIFALAISRPVILSEALDEDFIVIIDTSASMRAEDVSPNRFEYSKRDIKAGEWSFARPENEPY